MPQNNPLFGELWSTRNKPYVGGVIYNVSPTAVSIVGRTGHRISIPRPYFVRDWVLGTYPPLLITPCTRRDCTHDGWLSYTHRDKRFVSCPLHVPIGVTWVPNTNNTPLRHTDNIGHGCPICGNSNAVEDLRRNPQHFCWHCPACSASFVPYTLDWTTPHERLEYIARDIVQLFDTWPSIFVVQKDSLPDTLPNTVLGIQVLERAIQNNYIYAVLPRSWDRMGQQPPVPEVPTQPMCSVGEEWEDQDGILYRILAVVSERCHITEVKSSPYDPSMWIDANDFNRRFNKFERQSSWTTLLKDDD